MIHFIKTSWSPSKGHCTVQPKKKAILPKKICEPKELQLTYEKTANVYMKSKWNKGKGNVNQCTLGVEIENNIKGSEGLQKNPVSSRSQNSKNGFSNEYYE